MYKNRKVSYKLLKYLDKTQMDKLLARVKECSVRDWLMILVMWRTGIRVLELVNLTNGDIREECLQIRKGKGNKPRLVPIDNELLNLLHMYCDNLAKFDIVFPLSTAQVRNIVHSYEDSEFPYLKPHMFRHSFAVHCLKQGMNVRALQKILGHSDLSTTAVYLEIVGKDIKDEYQKVEW